MIHSWHQNKNPLLQGHFPNLHRITHIHTALQSVLTLLDILRFWLKKKKKHLAKCLGNHKCIVSLLFGLLLCLIYAFCYICITKHPIFCTFTWWLHITLGGTVPTPSIWNLVRSEAVFECFKTRATWYARKLRHCKKEKGIWLHC